MADADTTSHSIGTLETLQSNSNHPRRLRPPDLDMAAGDENRVPLRPETEKLGRRESKLGLRSLFGRHKTLNDVTGTSSMRELKNIRASLYGFHAAKSEVLLPTMPQPSPRPLSTTINPSIISQAKKSVPARTKTPTPTARSGRGSLATWDPPPLFQAYPQAIRHAHLPACTASAEALLRLHGSKGSISMREGFAVAELTEEPSSEKLTEKAKKKHRRNTSGSSFKLDWTNKIYVLVTSGYLLQYSAEGSFDRLPEKMLQLGKDSAAFASDLIPGKHWVLQVSSAMEPDRAHGSDSRSLFSRLPFRVSERRHASTFLMVFESAEDMEGWITTLRREIEHLGGKKSLSETGKPKADDHVLQLRAQPSQRTLVVRDPDRFSRVITQDLPWNQDMHAPDIHLEAPGSDAAADRSFDDVSTTNSMISQDGRQLESLRDSANRLSFISSGQRTMVTSEGSSPPCSPVRDSFASLADEPPYLESPQEARPRPNAAAILDRRQSMQTVNPLVDFRIVQSAPPRPLSTYSTTSWQEGTHTFTPAVQATTIPNFSVPHSAGRRYSLIKSPPLESSPAVLAQPPNGRTQPLARGTRRPPPPSLGSSRPLSIVADQPSPGATSPGLPKEPDNARDSLSSPESDAPETPPIFASWGQQNPQRLSKNDYELPSRNSSLAQIQLTVRTSPRKNASMQTLRPSQTPLDAQTELRTFVLPSTISIPRSSADENQRSKSSLDSYGRSRSRSPVTRKSKQALYKRSSMYTQPTEVMGRHAPTVPELKARASASASAATEQATATRPGPLVPRPSASNQHLRVHSASKALFNRRSMPQLIEGPPPAPPPTCALPPLPPQMSESKNRSSHLGA